MSVNNFKAIFTLIIFFLAQLLVIFPVHVPIPQACVQVFRKRKKNGIENDETSIKVPLDLHTAPLAAVLILLAAQCIHGSEIRNGIVGTDGVEPLNVMALFISLAYMTISVDKAGLLRFLAFWVATRTSQSGLKLYIALYWFFFVLGVIVGNDPVILSGVPFLAYFTHEVDIDPPTAWIFAQFVIANIASAVLVSSNPTNLVLSGAFGISFFSYTAKLIVPVIVAAIFVLPILLLQFRGSKFIPKRIKPLTLEPISVLTDPVGGVFGATLLILTLCTLVGTSIVHPPVYLVTVPPAVIVGIRDVAKDIFDYRKVRKESKQNSKMNDERREIVQEREKEKSRTEVLAPETTEHGSEPHLQRLPTTTAGDDTGTSSQTVRPAPLNQGLDAEDDFKDDPPPLPHRLQQLFPTTLSILKTMPFSLVLFSFCMFILVQGLVVTGWVEVWASWWRAWTTRTGPTGAVFGMGLVSCILCNISGTNIGATILLSRVLQTWIQSAQPIPSTRLRNASILALALGSNYGAFTFSFPASLAGLLWKRLLSNKGIVVTMGQFVKLNLAPVACAMGVSSLIVLGQVYIFDDG